MEHLLILTLQQQQKQYPSIVPFFCSTRDSMVMKTADAHRCHSRTSLDDGRHFRRSIGHTPRRPRTLADSGSNASSRGHGESNSFSYDEATLRQLLLEYVFPIIYLFRSKREKNIVKFIQLCYSIFIFSGLI